LYVNQLSLVCVLPLRLTGLTTATGRMQEYLDLPRSLEMLGTVWFQRVKV
jgi:hypothetical protein